mmetsp:Transcript_1428/g.2280  ORF Transcript_1428/g.2280 Transcript_1428/m.2280 type:complete len:90 (+) Transcript_1428:385-654(+)
MGLKKSVGSAVGDSDEETIGTTVGLKEGDSLDVIDGFIVGESDVDPEEFPDGTGVGTVDGTSNVGKSKLSVGANECEGSFLGESDGTAL